MHVDVECLKNSLFQSPFTSLAVRFYVTFNTE